MPAQKNTSIKWIFSILLLAVASLSFGWVYYQSEPFTELISKKEIESEEQVNVDEKAKKILRDMSNSLKDLKEFSLKSKGYFEVVDSATGKKEKMDNSGELSIKRPNKLKAQRTGEKSDIEFYCDGKTFTVYGKNLKYYASAPATASLDETFDKISERFNIQLPGMDLLYTDVYEGLMQDVVSGKYVGMEDVGDVKCNHLSFTGKDVDWQIWVEEGGMKLPRKYLITSKMIQGKPESSIEIKEWKTDQKLDDKMFTFTPPKGAQKIDFLQPKTDSQTKNE